MLTFEQIRTMKKNNSEFAFCILILIHSVCILSSIFSTAIFCRITNAVLTTLTIVLLSTYISVDFYIRFILFNDKNLHHSTIRLGFVLILLILIVPWTNIIVHEYRMNISIKEEIIYPRSTTFSWFLYLDFLLIISLLILTIRNQSDFSFYQIVFLSIGIPLASLWLYMGILMANNKIHHWIISISFYILSIIQIIHLIYITSKTILEYKTLSKLNDLTLFSLLIIIFICSGANLLIHLLTIVMSFVLMDNI
ncbi:unnamed protein product [Adineta steineri]|uniref:Uncharacterized protein n=1 Tax=Adineta steineri TaxID=433720 RepID=A0A814QH08_9BILA|nr:unnamed protein product [Adineta steineri]